MEEILSPLAQQVALPRLRGGAEPGFLQLRHGKNVSNISVGEQGSTGWEDGPKDTGLTAMEKLQRVIARRAALLQNAANASSPRASTKRSAATESDASTELESSCESSEEQKSTGLKESASVPMSVGKAEREEGAKAGAGEENGAREKLHSLADMMEKIEQDKHRKAVETARAAVEQDGGLAEASTASEGESEDPPLPSVEQDRRRRLEEQKLLVRHGELKRGITKDIAYRQKMDAFNQRLWQRPVHGEMHRIEERVPFDVGAALEKQRPGMGSYDIRDYQGRRVSFEMEPLEASNPHAVKALTPEEILRLPDTRRASGPRDRRGRAGMIAGREGVGRIQASQSRGLERIEDRKRDRRRDGDDKAERQRGDDKAERQRGRGAVREASGGEAVDQCRATRMCDAPEVPSGSAPEVPPGSAPEVPPGSAHASSHSSIPLN